MLSKIALDTGWSRAAAAAFFAFLRAWEPQDESGMRELLRLFLPLPSLSPLHAGGSGCHRPSRDRAKGEACLPAHTPLPAWGPGPCGEQAERADGAAADVWSALGCQRVTSCRTT